MNMYTTHPTNNLNRWTWLAAAIVAVTVMMPFAALSQTPAPVNLGSAANFAILSAAAITNIPTSAITGDVGLSPAAGSGITGLSAAEVTGTIFTVDATGPTGSVEAAAKLLSAKEDLTIAFNDAAGRTPIPTGSFLNPGAGNIGGMTLAAGLYKFTSSASIIGSDVTLTGSAADVWIFQIGSTLIIDNGLKVNLTGGAQATNIFWQVGSSATLGTTSVLAGTIMADQSITINAGARLDGRALAKIAAVTLSSNTITKPSEPTALKKDTATQRFALFQSFQNQSIGFSIPSDGRVSVRIINSLGKEVAMLFNGEAKAEKYHQVQFNTRRMVNGFYCSKLEFNGTVILKKMILVK
ncbi:MAG: DUF3494 domain-containing protein [Chitinivibrionales bacterium]|nr:DUF3494 domain-containing protein [Chitinivibrionales bacterium]